MLREVDPFDHKYPPLSDEVSVTDCPELIIVFPLAVMVGTGGGVQPFALIEMSDDVDLHPFVPVTVTR